MNEIDQRIAALEIAVQHIVQQLPADQLSAARTAINAELTALTESPAPQRTRVISSGAMNSSFEQNVDYGREVTDRYSREKALKRARALVDQWSAKR